MKARSTIGFALAAALMGGSALGGAAIVMPMATAGASDAEGVAKFAADAAAKAEKALARRDFVDAASHAEAAVGARPDHAAYRAMLGQAYLAGGRFLSAAQALGDALAIDPSNGRAALSLTLAQIALGDWQTARETLNAHAAHIGAADRGLALALSGDPQGAVMVLANAAREPTADAKVRQNLALSLALAGHWQEAKTIAAIDLSPADADKRILEWAAFARPGSASDQVAKLLGVTPVEDKGQPVRLALNARPEAMAAVVQPVVPAEADLSAMAPEPVEMAAAPAATRIVFAERSEVVQAVPVRDEQPVRLASVSPTARAVAASDRPADMARGSYYVQLGAFENAGVARDAWSRMSRRVAGLRGQSPKGMGVEVDGQNFYRLSVGGFARGDADRLCRQVRSSGGRCFVRGHAGEQVASWATGPQYASR
ncbi:tetratricopeptide repeat protein [Sphingomonas sp.]